MSKINPLARKILGLSDVGPDAPQPIMSIGSPAALTPSGAPIGNPVAAPLPSVTSRTSVEMPTESPQAAAQKSDLSNRFKELLLAQEQGIQRQQADFDAFKGRKQVPDLSAFGDLLDAVYGGKMGDQLRKQRGPTPEERQQILSQMETNMNLQRSHMTNQLKALIDSQQSGKMTDLLAKNERFQAGQAFRLNQSLDRTAQSFSKDAFEKMQQFEPVELALQPDANGMVSAGAINTVKSFAARALGEKGVLTDQDIGRVIPQALTARIAGLETYLTGDPNQKIPASLVAPLTEALKNAKQAVGHVSQKKLGAALKSFTVQGGSPEVGQGIVGAYGDPLAQVYGGGGGGAPLSSPVEAAPPAASGPSMTFQEWKARKAAKK